MSGKNTVDPIVARIRNQVSSLVQTDAFREWWHKERAGIGDCVVVNNSFLYRDKPAIKTRKSDKYLAVPVVDGPQLNLNDVRIISRRDDSTQIKDFVVVRKRDWDSSLHVSLYDAVREELGRLGRMIFLLIGEIEETTPVAQPCVFGSFNGVVLDPMMDRELSVEGSQVRIRSTKNPEVLWRILESVVGSTVSVHLSSKDKKTFTKALDCLREKEHGVLKLPTGPVSDCTLLDLISRSLSHQAQEYEQSLKEYQNDPSRQTEFNNMLRIAYNFDTEAGTIITLLISLCDLKPLLYWCTVFDHWRLYNAFEALPWAALSLKPSLKEYSESIRAARNSRFHHLLPIDSKLEADLEGVLLKAKKITLFDRYSRARGQTGNALDFEDKEIVELLLQFTHVEEKDVGDEFWVKNLEVIRCTADLVSSTCSALKMLVVGIP